MEGCVVAGHLAYVAEFLEEAKASGLIKTFIERAGLRGMKYRRPQIKLIKSTGRTLMMGAV